MTDRPAGRVPALRATLTAYAYAHSADALGGRAARLVDLIDKVATCPDASLRRQGLALLVEGLGLLAEYEQLSRET